MLRKRKPPRVAKAATAMMAAPENGTDRKKRRSMRGSVRRPSQTIRPTRAAGARMKAPTMIGDPQPRSGASMMPKVKEDEEHDHQHLADHVDPAGLGCPRLGDEAEGEHHGRQARPEG